VLAISCDPIASKQAWGKHLGGISYPLVSDFWPHGEMCKQYGVFNEEFGRPDRATYIVDTQGMIRWAKLYEPGQLPDNVEIIEALQQIRQSES
jgi:alkyl hydroperoxide reductase subunit AhpC